MSYPESPEYRRNKVVNFEDLPQGQYGDNVMADIAEAGKLIIEIDTKRNFGASKSGKTITVAYTRGNVRLQDEDGNEIVMGINVYKYPEAK